MSVCNHGATHGMFVNTFHRDIYTMQKHCCRVSKRSSRAFLLRVSRRCGKPPRTRKRVKTCVKTSARGLFRNFFDTLDWKAWEDLIETSWGFWDLGVWRLQTMGIVIAMHGALLGTVRTLWWASPSSPCRQTGISSGRTRVTGGVVHPGNP